ncbi:MAG TPA: glycosyltransferase family 39 protein [Patescibacteria group bacterium]|nr:glycosyltransferase family 39 protein [Patescibacteria group bacterium]
MGKNRFSLSSLTAERLAIIMILMLAALLRFVALGRDGLWTDECHGAVRTVLPLSQLVPQLAAEHQAPLYYLVQKLFVSATIQSEWCMRFSSALLGILAVALLWATTRKIVSARAGLIAAFLLAVSPLHVHYSREARNYTLLTLATLIALWAIVHLARRPTMGTGIIAGMAMLAVLYTHDIGAVYAAGVLAAGLVLTVRAPQRRAAFAALAMALAVAAVGYLPWLSSVISRSAAISIEYNWLHPLWQHEFPWQIGRSLAALSHGAMPPIRNHVRDLYWTVWPALGLSVLLIGLGFRHRESWRLPEGATALVLASLTPLFGIFVYSLVISPVYIVGRVDSAALPFFLILIAAGVAALPCRIAVGTLIAFVGLALLPLQVDLRLDTRSQERNIAKYLAATLNDGDVLVMACSYRSSQEYYLRFWKPRAVIQSFPIIRDLHPFWIDWSLYPGTTLDLEARAVGKSARDTIMKHRGKCVWVMFELDPHNKALLLELARTMNPGPVIDLEYMGLKLTCFHLEKRDQA